MSDTADTTLPVTINGVLLFASADPETFVYVPARPIAQDGGSGRPAVSAVRTPKAVLLQVGALFTLSNQDSVALTKHLIDAKLSSSPRLQPAPISIVKASLLLAVSDGQAREIATSSSSLYPPFNAIFSATLDATSGAAAIAAINGRTSMLSVQYRFTLPDALAQQGKSLSGMQNRLADVASWFPGGSGAAHIQISG
jgi:hypothetical protein